MEKILKVVELKKGFEYQGPRTRELGCNSGEEFRDDFLIPWLKSFSKGDLGIVDFSGTKVYMSSFLEEAFGGAVREGYSEIVKKLQFINMDKDSQKDLLGYIATALKK